LKHTKSSGTGNLINSVPAGTVTLESWDSLFHYWNDRKNLLNWNCIFVIPQWLKSWWDTLGKELEPYICSVWHGGTLTGIAPLIIDGNTARVMGNSDLSDYIDFIVVPGRESLFFTILFGHMRQKGITSFEAGQVRADSAMLQILRSNADDLGCTVSIDSEARLYEVDLPRSWGEYLHLLSGKERHEVRRKLRRLHESGLVTYRVLEKKEEVHGGMDTFITLFRKNVVHKKDFMTSDREAFFRTLSDALAEAGLMRLSFLEIDGMPAAGTLCFDYHSTVYIYNNGYDKKFRSLGVGLLSKVFSLQDSIEKGRKKYDFLRGDEAYKEKLGGVPVQLYRCWVKLV
jgi:CelD/BcsL family acetyltransferase involved in cellulose biosynthesis